jgi:hypothetical protein
VQHADARIASVTRTNDIDEAVISCYSVLIQIP